MIAFLKAHKRAIVPALATAWTVFLLVHPDEWGRFVDLSFFTLFVMLIASQFFWFGRILDLAKRVLSGNPRRAWLAAVAWLLYVFVFVQCIVVLGVVLAVAGFLLLHPDELAGSVD